MTLFSQVEAKCRCGDDVLVKVGDRGGNALVQLRTTGQYVEVAVDLTPTCDKYYERGYTAAVVDYAEAVDKNSNLDGAPDLSEAIRLAVDYLKSQQAL